MGHGEWTGESLQHQHGMVMRTVDVNGTQSMITSLRSLMKTLAYIQNVDLPWSGS